MLNIPLEKIELKELLNKCWMTHDAVWFYNCLQECGIKKTNKINRAAVRALAAVEIKRIEKAVGVEKIETFGDFWNFFQVAMAILTGNFMKYSFESTQKNHIRGTWHQCFAHEALRLWGLLTNTSAALWNELRAGSTPWASGIKWSQQ